MDASLILNTPTSGINKTDEVIWNYEAKGVFSVKSAYHLASNLALAQEASPSIAKRQSPKWRSFWKLKTIPKVKFCVWRIIHDTLPTKMNIIKKRINTNPICLFCRNHEEDASQLFWNCKMTKKIWKNHISLTKGLFALDRNSWKPKTYWQWLADNLESEDLSLAIVILWSIWTHRNSVKHNEVSPEANKIIRLIESSFIKEDKRVQSHQVSVINSRPPSRRAS